MSADERDDAGVASDELFPHPELEADDGVEFAAGADGEELCPHPEDDGAVVRDEELLLELEWLPPELEELPELGRAVSS